MRYQKIDSGLFVKNRKKLCERLEKKSLVILKSYDELPRSADMEIFPYKANPAMFYLSGVVQEGCALVLCPDHPDIKMREILFLKKTNPTMEIWYGKKLDFEAGKEISAIENVKWIEDFYSVLNELMLTYDTVYLNTNEHIKAFSTLKINETRFIKEIKTHYPLHNYKRLAPIIRELRMIKEPEEIELIKKACQITRNAFMRVLKTMKPDITEYEIEAEITYEFIKSGANGHAYHPIIAAGENNCFLHYNDNDKICKAGDLVLMDFGAEYAGYAADTTRTIPVSGKFSERQKVIYNAVLNVQKQTIALMRPGISLADLNEKANSLMEKELIKIGLLDAEEVAQQNQNEPLYKKYYMHGTSHFIGLDVHDVGTKQTILCAGMMLTCEPAIYIAEEGFGIRLEDDILITNAEPINLLADEPLEIADIERIMNEKE